MKISNLGKKLAQKRLGISDQELSMAKGASETMSKDIEGEFGRVISKFAAEVLDHAGDDYKFSTQRFIFESLSKEANWDPCLNKRFVAPVLRALGKVCKEEDSFKSASYEEAMLLKEAAGSAGGITTALGNLLGGVDNLALTLAIPAILSGAAGGSLLWGANKLSEPLDLETKLLTNRRNHYERLAREIKEEMANDPSIDTEEEIKQLAEETNDYLV